MKLPFFRSPVKSLVIASSVVLLTACSSSDDNDTNTNTSDPMPAENPAENPPLGSDDSSYYGYVFTRGPRYQSGQIERISLDDGNTVVGTYPPTTSDHAVATDGESVYEIGRYLTDTLAKFSATDTSLVEFDISVIGDVPETSNPQSLAIANSDLAYLTRRETDKLLLIDPTPDQPTAESVITGEISLANYNRGTGDNASPPAMTDAVIVDDMLFVLIENLDQSAPNDPGYLAVIDTRTNLEVTTGKGEFPRQGIRLQTANPVALHYNEDTGLLYVTGRGNAFGVGGFTGDDAYTGGVESIDPTTYLTTLLVDDGTESENNGFFVDAIVVNDTLGYLITLDGFNADFSAINNLRTFNPSTGEVSEPVSGTAGQSLTTMAVGPDNHLWVGIQSNTPGFLRIDLDTGVPAEQMVTTNLIPSNMVFIEVPQ